MTRAIRGTGLDRVRQPRQDRPREGIGLARRIPELLANLVQRVESLLEAGWKEVRVVTDHGWLLMPKGLPKSELPKYPDGRPAGGAVRWSSRRPRSTFPASRGFGPRRPDRLPPEASTASWRARNINHGGLSLQECVVPQLIRPGDDATVSAKIESFKWAGLRCRIKVTGDFDGCMVDLRDKAADPDPIAGSEASRGQGRIGGCGRRRMIVTKVRRRTLVLLDHAGNVLDKRRDGGGINGQLDQLDRLAADAFDGYIVRKDLVRKFARQYPVPTYVCEFLLGRYCASIDEEEIQEGLQIVERQLRDRAVRSGEEELFKARARETGSVKLIDIISARLDAKTDSYLATLPSLQLKDVRIEDKLVRDNERMLTGGFYAEIDLNYDAVDRPGEKAAGRFRSPACGPSSSPSGTCWTRSTRDGGSSPPPTGRTSCSAASAWSRPR